MVRYTMHTLSTSKTDLMALLAAVKDPEVPVLDIVEMGIVRDVRLADGTVSVDITPTYSGCPAMKAIEDEIVRTLHAEGYADVQVNLIYTEAWTTDWMTDEARQKLKAYGIAPPEKKAGEAWLPFSQAGKVVPCPWCNARDTRLTSPFGSTACKALHYCNACHQPFEHFKCI